MLVVERETEALHDATIADLPRWLRSGDALALNETRVLPARLHVQRRPTGGRVELLFVRAEPEDPALWRTLARPARALAPGAELESADGRLGLEVVARGEGGVRIVRVVRGRLREILEREGEIPLPPYIHRAASPEDRERYQTVFAREEGAVAAPTAGLHLTYPLLGRLEELGVLVARLVLHVGPGTFQPIQTADPYDHPMDEEYFELGPDAATRLRQARERGGRIVAVGTTVVRALESASELNGGAIAPARGWTRKFIAPPYRFQSVDALLTNFHLPRTTLLLLVAAFAGIDRVKRAYRHAVEAEYRFYSYGDAMLLV